MFKYFVSVIGYLLLLLALGSSVKSVEVESEFARGNSFFEAKNYDSAVVAYKAVLTAGTESAAIYYNLGNAYFKRGDLGLAVANYIRALRLDPSDDDIRQNLEFAQRFTSIQMEGVELNPITSFLSSIVESYRLAQLGWTASILFVLLVFSLVVRYGVGLNNSIVRVSITVLLILVVASSGLTSFKYRTEYVTKRAVVLVEDCNVYTGPSDLSDIELTAAPGLVVLLLDESEGFYNVLFENKRRGWISKELVVEI